MVKTLNKVGSPHTRLIRNPSGTVIDFSYDSIPSPKILINLDTDEISKTHMDELLRTARRLLNNQTISKKNMVSVAFKLIDIGDNYNISGHDKKRALIHALDLLIEDTNKSHTNKFELKMMAHDVISQVIDDHFKSLRKRKGWWMCC